MHLVGELDLATAPVLDQALRAADADLLVIVVDLRDLSFMDCSGIHVLRDASERLRAEGRRLVVIRGPRHVDQVFRLTQTAHGIELLDLAPAEPAVQVLVRLAGAEEAAHAARNGNGSTNGSRPDPR